MFVAASVPSRSSRLCCSRSAARTTSPFCSAYPVSRRGRSIMYRSTNRHGQWRSGQAATASSVQAATARWPGASMARPGGRATPATTLDENSRPSRREGARCLLKRLWEKPLDRHALHSRRWQRRCHCAATGRVARPLDRRSVLRRWWPAPLRPGPAPMAPASGNHDSVTRTTAQPRSQWRGYRCGGVNRSIVALAK